MKKNGTVYLVGAGPGSLSLLTLRAKELVEQADCIVYDALVSPYILRWAKPGCKVEYVGKRASNHSLPQDETNRLLVKLAQEYDCVVRLKGGDPYVFGRGGEEAEELLRHGIRFEEVPGVSSALAGPAYAGIPVTHRDSCTQFTVFTGHETPDKKKASLDIAGIAQASGTKIMLMGMQKLEEILSSLIAEGQDAKTPAAVIQWATTPRQRSLLATVATLAEKAKQAGFGAPSIVVIGDVVLKSEQLNWFEHLPLFGRRIVVTRTQAQASELSQALNRWGAETLELPVIRIEEPSDRQAFAETVVDCHRYDWLVFTSPNGVEKFFQAFFAVYSDIRCLGGARIAAVGSQTAKKLKSYGLAVDVQPKKAVAEELVKAFKLNVDTVGSIENTTMLWVHGEQARRVVADELSAMGAIVDECLAYRTVPENQDIYGAQVDLVAHGADLITFTSASTVDNFFALQLKIPGTYKVASIGPVTTAALKAHGIKPFLEAKTHDIAGMIEAILSKHQK